VARNAKLITVFWKRTVTVNIHKKVWVTIVLPLL